MKLRTDDEIWRARLLYLGPPGYTLPFQLPYAQYGLFAVLCAGLTTGAVMLTGTWKAAGLAIAASIVLTWFVWQHVDPDRPARKVLRVAWTDRRRLEPQPERRLPRLTASHIRFVEYQRPNRPASQLRPTGTNRTGGRP